MGLEIKKQQSMNIKNNYVTSVDYAELWFSIFQEWSNYHSPVERAIFASSHWKPSCSSQNQSNIICSVRLNNDTAELIYNFVFINSIY